jgi:hypothetical protein
VTVIRQTGRFLAVHFDLPPCVERALVIRKLFTSGLNATTVTASALSSTGAMRMSIWSSVRRQIAVEPEAAIARDVGDDFGGSGIVEFHQG